MTTHRSDTRPTIGLLAGWQIYGRTNRVNFLGPVLLGIRSAAQELGADLLLACGLGPDGGSLSRARPAWPAPSPDSDFVPVGPWNTDGLIVLNPLLSAERSAAVREMIATGHPVVCIGAAEGGPAIAIENGGAIRQALDHLLAHGHRRIAFIAGNPEDLSGDGDERLRAYRAAVRDCGLPLDERLIAYGYHVTEGGRQAMRELLDRAVPFTAVIASNDESAIGAAAVLRESGRAVPGDVAVVGMDDQPCALAHAPPLTTLHVPTFEMGYQAVRLLADVIAGRVDGAPVLRLPARLVVRQSCGCDAGVNLSAATLAQDAPPLADAVARAVLLGLQQLRLEDVALLAGRLVAAWRAGLEGDGWDAFRQTVAALAQLTGEAGDSAHAWQAALSQLRAGLVGHPPAGQQQALDVLDWARALLSEQVQRQHRQHLVDQVQSAERIGLLTAQLQSALDEEQIYAALAGALPEAGVACVGIAFFEPADGDPVAWARLRRLGPGQPAELRFRSRAFPPPELLDEGAPAQLALFPLARGDTAGVMIFASADLELCATIARQVGAAFRTVQLYREAVRGQRLAEEANRLKSHFLSIVSHELRTPLSLILELSGLLVDGRHRPPARPQQEDLERIHASARHLDGLIRDVLELARTDVGQMQLAYEVVEIGQVLEIVAVVGEQLVREKGLRWSARIPPGLPRVWGDPARLRQVALNLISNAAKFTAQGGVALEVEARGQTVVITVRDSGPGVPPEEQEAIFDEFRQSSRTAARGYGGLGLGLAICKRLVERHGGEIGVVSSGAPGAGAAFWVALPALPEAERPADQMPGTVLVVAEQSGDAQELGEHIAQQGLTMRLVSPHDAAEWLPQIGALAPQALLLRSDAALAQGWSILKTLKANPATQDIPVLFYAPEPDRSAVLELDYLTKPVGSVELARALDRYGLAGQPEEGHQTVLVVEDDPGMLDVHTRLVQLHLPGCRVLRARDGREALNMLRSELPQLILLDLQMPELDGFGVLEALRSEESLRAIPVIVITAQALTQEDMARLNQGVVAVLSKGVFSTGEALHHIDAALARRRKLGSTAQQLVRKAMALIHTCYAEDITPADIARHVNMNEDYLARCFRQELGLTPMAYLNRYRISQAKQLLTSSDKTISEIALGVGFSTSSHFSQVFRREVGMAPRDYRQQPS
ncbi:MAG TPA: substrate-binding domain-containing protein [Roseiflexaceae bacterium]|nr:substrate-binding domain-containing protein [Roseiflexaceae bacterium]